MNLEEHRCVVCGEWAADPPLCEKHWAPADDLPDVTRREVLPILCYHSEEQGMESLAFIVRESIAYAVRLSPDMVTNMQQADYLKLSETVVDQLLDDIKAGYEQIKEGEYQ